MKNVTITKKDVGMRIDKFLAKELPSYARGEIIRNIKNGDVLVISAGRRKKVKPSYKLRGDDIINLKLKVQSSKLIPNPKVEFKISYKDNDIIIVNKPAGLKVHPVESQSDHGVKLLNTLVNGLLSKFPEIKNINDGSPGSELRPGIIHRLDKDTSGIMVIARNQESFNELKMLFKRRRITKKYLAVVYGKLKVKKGVIKKPIARARNYKKQVIASRKTITKIREAITEYKVVKEYKEYSLVELIPYTGRMHQIRIHLFSLNHPIVGDKIYKFKSKFKVQPSSFLRLNLGAKRQLLHAEKLEFKLIGKKYSFQAELPNDFSDFLNLLETLINKNT